MRHRAGELSFSWDVDADERPVEILESSDQGAGEERTQDTERDPSSGVGLANEMAGARSPRPATWTSPVGLLGKPLLGAACLLGFLVGWSWGADAKAADGRAPADAAPSAHSFFLGVEVAQR